MCDQPFDDVNLTSFCPTCDYQIHCGTYEDVYSRPSSTRSRTTNMYLPTFDRGYTPIGSSVSKVEFEQKEAEFIKKMEQRKREYEKEREQRQRESEQQDREFEQKQREFEQKDREFKTRMKQRKGEVEKKDETKKKRI